MDDIADGVDEAVRFRVLGPDLEVVRLHEDVAEMTNVAAENPEIVAQLRKMHEAWLTDVSKPRGTADD